MSVSLASHQAQNPLAAQAGEPTPALATDPFAVGPGSLLLLLLLGLVLVAAIGHVLALVWAVIRQALPVLGILFLALAMVVLVELAAVKQSAETPLSPAPTTSRSVSPPATGRAAPRPTRTPRQATPSSFVPRSGPRLR